MHHNNTINSKAHNKQYTPPTNSKHHNPQLQTMATQQKQRKHQIQPQTTNSPPQGYTNQTKTQ